MTKTEARRLLAVDATASRAELKRAYRRMLKLWHPDRFASSPSDGLAALRKTQIINVAYQLLDAEAQNQVVREPGWNGVPIQTFSSDWWPIRALVSNTTSAAEGILIFVLVWALLAGTAVAVDKLILH